MSVTLSQQKRFLSKNGKQLDTLSNLVPSGSQRDKILGWLKCIWKTSLRPVVSMTGRIKSC